MSLGSYLRKEREQRHISVAELAQTTRIPVRILRYLENDDHDELPADVFVRGYLRAYARALNLPEEQVLTRLGEREPSDAPPPLTVVQAPEPGRRFGIAIALFILLILFTLALSIVLRPRHRDAPIELSSHADPAADALALQNVGQNVGQNMAQDAGPFDLSWDPASSAKPSYFVASTTGKPTASSRC